MPSLPPALAVWIPPLVLPGIVIGLLAASRRRNGRRLFAWLPIPLWCYGVPMVLRTIGWLPGQHAAYPWITNHLFPIALVLLLLGVDLAALRRVGAKALIAMTAGAAGIVLAGPLLLRLFRDALPADSWKGIGTLAATWTGGSLNMVAMRSVLDVPEPVFAPLVVVDALVAYSWMACLIACRSRVDGINRWLGAVEPREAEADVRQPESLQPDAWRPAAAAALLAIGLALGSRWLAQCLPRGGLVSSATGWTVLLASTGALALAASRRGRQLSESGGAIGYPCLYVVLAALGAQADLTALAATPAWIAVGFCWVAMHAIVLLLVGRALRLPFGLLATASQANLGGVVSAPLVGAVYRPSLAPVGLLLALAGNALGTYLGLFAASLARALTP